MIICLKQCFKHRTRSGPIGRHHSNRRSVTIPVRLIGPDWDWTEVEPFKPAVQPMNWMNRSVPCKSTDSIDFFFQTTSKQLRFGVLSLQPPKSKPSLLPSQQLSAYRSTRRRCVMACNTQSTPARGRYKPATLLVVAFSNLPSSLSWRWSRH